MNGKLLRQVEVGNNVLWRGIARVFRIARIKYNVCGVSLYIRLTESAHWRVHVLLKRGE